MAGAELVAVPPEPGSPSFPVREMRRTPAHATTMQIARAAID
jgi:hypothetical protein